MHAVITKHRLPRILPLVAFDDVQELIRPLWAAVLRDRGALISADERRIDAVQAHELVVRTTYTRGRDLGMDYDIDTRAYRVWDNTGNVYPGAVAYGVSYLAAATALIARRVEAQHWYLREPVEEELAAVVASLSMHGWVLP